MTALPLIALAGGLGAGARFIVDGFVTSRSSLTVPVGTLFINVVGSFLLGLLTGWVVAGGSATVASVAGTGFLGGFTTFSTASVELVRLVQNGRWAAAAGLGLGMLLASVLAAWFGYALTAP